MDPVERFWSHVDKTGDCWLWTASKMPDGYGWATWRGRNMPAHRAAYLIAVGPIPDGLELDHLCRNRPCVRPSHLEAVTHAENVRRSWPATATHCRRGHEYTPDNIVRPRPGQRQCRECKRRTDSARTYSAAKRQRDREREHDRYVTLRALGLGSREAKRAAKSEARYVTTTRAMLAQAAEALEAVG